MPDHLIIGGLDAVELAEKYGTPLYVSDERRIRENFREFRRAFPDADIYFAVKANGNVTILRILAQEGAGADVFSDGELYLALFAGIPKEKILFNGNSKRDDELRMAVETGVRISVDSMDELRALSRIGKEVEIAFRVNPDVSPSTHPKISTGLRESKFGIPWNEVTSAYAEAANLENVIPVGIHCHIGSQILDLDVFSEATERMMDLVEEVLSIGIELEFVDLGGGLGIPYREEEEKRTPEDLAEAILPIFERRRKSMGISPRLILEPGRYIVANSTILLSRVNTVKKHFVGIDAGFNLLVRPVMYDAYHRVAVANKMDKEPKKRYTIVGPICESGDIIARDRMLPEIEKGDLIAIFDTGAYGFSMSSQYNGRTRCAEVLVYDGRADIIRKRETFDDLLHNQIIPDRFL
ncbi:MAG: diaminopimelate decarboxylase [Candidatus Syntropharchaeia archaeon]